VAPANEPYFSFIDVCDALSLNADCLRRELLTGGGAILKLIATLKK
jgi:hypothetical protein